LRRRLERAAARNNRSMNTEIIHRLEQSFEFEVVSERLARRGTPEGESELVPIGSSDRGSAPLSRVLALIDAMNKKLDRIIDTPEAEESKDEGEKK
jgi:hypothetical protein